MLSPHYPLHIYVVAVINQKDFLLQKVLEK